MIITNISSKLICMCGKSVLPGDSIKVADQLVNEPIRTLERVGLVSVVEEPRKKNEVRFEETVEKPKAKRTPKKAETEEKAEEVVAE